MAYKRRTFVILIVYTLAEIVALTGFLYWVDQYKGGLSIDNAIAAALELPKLLGDGVALGFAYFGMEEELSKTFGAMTYWAVNIVASVAILAFFWKYFRERLARRKA